MNLLKPGFHSESFLRSGLPEYSTDQELENEDAQSHGGENEEELIFSDIFSKTVLEPLVREEFKRKSNFDESSETGEQS